VAEPITLDFETAAIVGNPILNPPRPAGLAVWIPQQEPFYLAWGHPEFEVGDPRFPEGSKNDCTYAQAHEYVGRFFQSKEPLLFHNSSFDMSVAEHWFCNAAFPWHESDSWKRIHDTMYLLFLCNPYSTNLSLKPNADHYLDMPAEEQDALYDWICKYVPGANRKNAGAFIADAPAALVRRYAIGDVVRTRKLYDLLLGRVEQLGIRDAYDRERRLFPITYHGTKRGIRIDRDTLIHHERVYTTCHEMAGDRLATALGCSVPDLDSDVSLAEALTRSGAVTDWVVTKTGKKSMAKDNLVINDPEVKKLVEYRGALETCLQTFMRPWIAFSEKDGRLHPNWNQVRQPRNDYKSKGTRTGRLSSDSPNFQNVPTEYTDNLGHELAVPEGLHPVPYMRRYCLPEPGHLWIKRDFSSQEIRILAHFEDGSLCEAYRADPGLDPHKMAQGLIEEMVHILYARKDVKITGFSIIYGSGVRGLSAQLGQPYEDAFRIKASYLAALPGVQDLMESVQARGRAGQPIRTWGGRLYWAEPGKVIEGRWRDFYYKLLNYLIQGSAADHTKEAINDWQDMRSWDAIFLATVHDELDLSVPEDAWAHHMAVLREAMDRDRFDVPIRSEGFVGPNWHDLSGIENEYGTQSVQAGDLRAVRGEVQVPLS
jgi:DNA polymerase I-like protein with 3'-5' exonuclease and polymerase domains